MYLKGNPGAMKVYILHESIEPKSPVIFTGKFGELSKLVKEKNDLNITSTGVKYAITHKNILYGKYYVTVMKQADAIKWHKKELEKKKNDLRREKEAKKAMRISKKEQHYIDIFNMLRIHGNTITYKNPNKEVIPRLLAEKGFVVEAEYREKTKYLPERWILKLKERKEVENG